ncbi:hypothetical protein CASFOL_006266 [Castilleja foliolosa]|uniref:Uncharacterized protein n=1 Tax=Castilleja foliolosa TaxID=1961234 RepID=A0ABD3E6A8_9LAMI
MPPVPAMRISPQRDLKAENHKRGRSLESGFLFRDKDDDLALFNEVQSKERDNFLLQSNDDFDDIFSSKLRHFSDNKHRVSVPARGESSDLLNAEGDKNDYDWLITPPETPLFPSLDDEAPSASLTRMGRPRSQPITISRSSTMEKGYRSARSSASPHRLSPSPRSVNSTLQSRSSRPFSANHLSPPPSRRLSPSPRKPSPPPRTSTPTPRRMSTPSPRRMSTGSAGPTPQSRARGPSPVKTTRGNSSSPKISAWQSNVPGFSTETPPNLRTSLDRPMSYVRGSSPASRNGFRPGRQSMSPTASRSISSSHSHERDQFSSHSKGSVGSSCDDDIDSLQSNPISFDHSAPRSVGAYPNNRAMGLPKKANKVVSISAPKRSFDLALRQMERKGPPQNMFRPLLSSVPSSTFYVGQGNAHHRALTSKNSSFTTSSNASSDQGTGGALDIEESVQTQEDMTSVFTKGQYPTTAYDEIFDMDQPDASDEPVEIRINENDEPSAVISDVVVPEGESDCMELCSKCSQSFHSSKLIREGDMWLCLECKSSKINSTTIIPVNSEMVDNNATEEFVQIMECRLLDVLDCDSETVKEQIDSIEDLDISTIEEGELNIATQQEINQSVGPSGVCSNTTVDVSEGTGISLLLKRSSSGKGHIVQNRSFTASNISYEDFSYTRDSVNSMRSSIGHSSASVSSSFDLGTRIHRQSSGRKPDVENYRHETPVKHRRSVSSLSGGASSHVFLEVSAVNPHERSLASECMDAESTYTDIECRLINNVYSGDNTSVVSEELTASHENGDNLANVSSNSIIEEISAEISARGDDVMQSSLVERVDVSEVPQTSGLGSISEIEIENADIVVSADPQSDVDSTTSKSCPNELVECSVSSALHDDVIKAAVEDFDISFPVNGVLEESTVLLEDLDGTKPRSLTLEEATDAILFCSSIVHNLAYKAANIATGEDNSPVEALQPAVTFVGKSNSDRRELRSRATGRRSSKSQKVRQRKLETDNTKPPVVAESDEKPSQGIVRSPSKGDSMNPPKLESKCNCVIM